MYVAMDFGIYAATTTHSLRCVPLGPVTLTDYLFFLLLYKALDGQAHGGQW